VSLKPSCARSACVDAGETVDDLAADYGLERAEIEQAVLYERAA
jgi:uncharacterized protein (DUF433 family)